MLGLCNASNLLPRRDALFSNYFEDLLCSRDETYCQSCSSAVLFSGQWFIHLLSYNIVSIHCLVRRRCHPLKHCNTCHQKFSSWTARGNQRWMEWCRVGPGNGAGGGSAISALLWILHSYLIFSNITILHSLDRHCCHSLWFPLS